MKTYTLEWQHDKKSPIQKCDVIEGEWPTGRLRWNGEPEYEHGYWISGDPLPRGGMADVPYAPKNIRWFFSHAIGMVNTLQDGWVELWNGDCLIYSHGVYEESKAFNPAPIMTDGKKDLGKSKRIARRRKAVIAQ